LLITSRVTAILCVGHNGQNREHVHVLGNIVIMIILAHDEDLPEIAPQIVKPGVMW